MRWNLSAHLESSDGRAGKRILLFIWVIEMTDLIEALFSRLRKKGLTPVEINRLVKDVFYIIADAGLFSVSIVNKKLLVLGWQEKMIDELTLELIVTSLQEKGCYTFNRHTIH